MAGAPAVCPSAAILHLPEVDSTNAEAFRLAARGERGPLWVLADRQVQGRGRSGRSWTSPPGNLYASLLLELACTPAEALQLSLVAGVAVHDAVSRLVEPRVAASLRLKWPNDLMIGPAKMGGILVETASSGATLLAVVGIGLNLRHVPAGLDRLATCLADHGPAPAATDVHARMAGTFAAWLSIWREGRGFPEIRDAWLARGPELGATLSVNTGLERAHGAFAGLGPSGELLLRDSGGRVSSFTFGDVTEAAHHSIEKDATPR